jgi:DNA-binding transcriptional ArsR family regulator
MSMVRAWVRMGEDGVMDDAQAAGAHAAVDTADVAELFNAVSDRTRLALLRFVMTDEHCVADCSAHIGLTHSAASKQLNALAHAGLLSRRPAGRRNYYRATDPEAVTKILDAAGSLIARRRLR